MTVCENKDRWDKSNVLFTEGVIKSYSKKQQTPDMCYIDYGLGVFDAAAFTGWPANKAFDLADVYRDLIAKKELAGHEVKQRFYEIGSPEGLAELDALLRSQQLSPK
jgi:NDP-sugar pyrophosphorylase family protein